MGKLVKIHCLLLRWSPPQPRCLTQSMQTTKLSWPLGHLMHACERHSRLNWARLNRAEWCMGARTKAVQSGAWHLTWSRSFPWYISTRMCGHHCLNSRAQFCIAQQPQHHGKRVSAAVASV